MSWNEEAGLGDEQKRDAQTVTVAELDKLIEEIVKKENEVLAAEVPYKERKKELLVLEDRMVAYLKDLERDEYASPKGVFKIEQKWRVNMPKEDLDKKALFDHLREREIFDKYATVNSNSLNALFRADWEAAKARGEDMTFSMPGVPAPNLYEMLKYKSKIKRSSDDE